MNKKLYGAELNIKHRRRVKPNCTIFKLDMSAVLIVCNWYCHYTKILLVIVYMYLMIICAQQKSGYKKYDRS